MRSFIIVALLVALVATVASANKGIKHGGHHRHQHGGHNRHHIEGDHDNFDQDVNIDLNIENGGHERSIANGLPIRGQFDEEIDVHEGAQLGFGHGLGHGGHNQLHHHKGGFNKIHHHRLPIRHHHHLQHRHHGEEFGNGPFHHGLGKHGHKHLRRHGWRHRRPHHIRGGAIGVEEGSFGGVQSHDHLDSNNFANGHESSVLGNNNRFDLDHSDSDLNENEGIRKHQVFNKDNTFINSKSSGVNDVDGFRNTNAHTDADHLGSSSSNIAAQEAGGSVGNKVDLDRDFSAVSGQQAGIVAGGNL